MPNITPDIVNVRVSEYRVQLQSLNGQTDRWMDVFQQIPCKCQEGSHGTHPELATFTDVVEAEDFLNDMRDRNKHAVYRMIRDLTITEVVHA